MLLQAFKHKEHIDYVKTLISAYGNLVSPESSKEHKDKYLKLVDIYKDLRKGGSSKEEKGSNLKEEFEKVKDTLFTGDPLKFNLGNPIDKDTHINTTDLKDLTDIIN